MTLFDDPPAAPPLPPLTEADIAAGVLDYLSEEHNDVLSWLRKELVRIYREQVEVFGRTAAFVTADNARQILHRCPVKVPSCKNFMGAVFKAKGWKPTGEYHKSTTPASHGNRLVRWRFEE